MIARMIATVIDWALILLLISPIAIASAVTNSNSIMTTAMLFADLIPLALYSTLVFFRRQSPGRSLLHIRVVNQYGLKIGGKSLVARDIVRNLPIWFGVLASVAGEVQMLWFATVTATIGTIVLVFLVLDTAFLAFYDHGRCLHDIIFKTRVVLDTESK